MNKKFFEKKVAKFGFVAFALALGLAACGDGGSTNGPANDDDSSSSSSVSGSSSSVIPGTDPGSPSSSSEKSGSISSSSSPKPNSSSSEINGDNSGENGAFFITKNVTTSLSTMGTSSVTEIAYNYLDIQSQYLYETLYSMSMYSNDKLISSSISKAAYIKDGSSCGAGFDACNRICPGDVPFYVSGTQTCADIEFVGEVNSYKKYKISGDSYSYYDKDGVLRITESGSMKIEYYDKKVMDNFTYRCARTSQNGSLLYDACEEFKVLKSTNSNVSIQTSYTYSGMNVVNLVEYEYFKFGYTSNGITTNGSSSSVASSSSAESSSSSVIPGSSSFVIPGTDPGSPSSSSVIQSSSSEGTSIKDGSKYDASANTLTDLRDNQVYKTVTIGTQIWMAENLNYAYTGVKYNYGSYTSDSTSWCYEKNEASNCDKYGRLYTWSAVMDSAAQFPVNAGTNCGFGKTCTPKSPHRGICPEGWHVPTNEEYSTLYTYIGGSSTAGSLLKSTSGWNDYNGKSGNGTDKYGFSVLPAGSRYYDGNFYPEGYSALLWSASEYDSYYVWSKSFYYDGDYADLDSYYFKNLGHSLRCLKDSGSVTSSSSVASSSSMKAAWAYLNPNIDYGEFTDERDGQVYKTVKIGTQTWMAENLNYDPDDVSDMGEYARSSCYKNKTDSCAKYGRLYTWEVAMDDAACAYGKKCNPSSIVQGICPSGWRLPTNEDWQKLLKPMATSIRDGTTYWDYCGAGVDLKTVDGWYVYPGSTAGTNASGFSALPYDEKEATFWSASEGYDYGAYYLRLYFDLYRGDDCAVLNDGVSSTDMALGNKGYGLSVRCLKD